MMNAIHTPAQGADIGSNINFPFALQLLTDLVDAAAAVGGDDARAGKMIGIRSVVEDVGEGDCARAIAADNSQAKLGAGQKQGEEDQSGERFHFRHCGGY